MLQPLAHSALQMLKKLSVALVLASVVTVSLSTEAAPVLPQYSHGKKQDIGEARAAAIAARNSGGKVLKVKRQGNGYKVKVLQPSGRVKNVWVDANSGKMKSSKK